MNFTTRAIKRRRINDIYPGDVTQQYVTAKKVTPIIFTLENFVDPQTFSRRVCFDSVEV